MNRFIQIDLTVAQRHERQIVEGIPSYYVLLSGSGIEIILFHTAAYFDKVKKFVVTIAEME